MKKLFKLVFLIQGIVCATAFAAAPTSGNYDGSVSLPVRVVVADGTKFEVSGVYDFGKNNMIAAGNALNTVQNVKLKASFGNNATEGVHFSIPKEVVLKDNNGNDLTVALNFKEKTGVKTDADTVANWRMEILDTAKSSFEVETVGSATLTGKEAQGYYTGIAKIKARIK